MNKARFARLSKLIEELSAIRDEEQDAFDNLPENFQGGSQGETMQEGIDVMDEALSTLEVFIG
jgi:hypothetical protein